MNGVRAKARELNDIERRILLQKKHGISFVGFASGGFSASTSGKGAPNIACNCGGIITVKADEAMAAGDMVAIDFPSTKGVSCAQQPGASKHKQTLVVIKYDEAMKRWSKEFAEYFKDKYENPGALPDQKQMAKDVALLYMAAPQAIGQCRAGCSAPGEMIDVKLDSKLRAGDYNATRNPKRIKTFAIQ